MVVVGLLLTIVNKCPWLNETNFKEFEITKETFINNDEYHFLYDVSSANIRR